MNKMKFMLYALIAMFATSMTACSDDDDNSFENLPSNVQKAFSDKYPNSRVDEWKKKDVYYVIDFKINNAEAEAWFENSTWRMTERDATFESLPDSVAKVFKAGPYSEWRVDDIDIVERNSMPTLFVIEVEKGDKEIKLYYFEDGRLLKEVADNDKDDEYLPRIPAKVNEVLAQMYPGYVLLDAEFENGMYEVELMHQNMKKEAVFGKDFVWMYSKWNVSPNDLPKEVLDFIEKDYNGYIIDEVEFVTTANKGEYYEIELEKGDSEIKIKVSPKGELIK